MVKRRAVANPLALAVLAFLSNEPMHPYALGRRLEETEKDRDFRYNRGSLYMVIKQLTKAGFVAERETVRESSRPDRTLYEITGSGRDELHDWLRELLAEPQEEYPLFGAALSLLIVLAPKESAELLERRLAALEGLREETRAAIGRATEQNLLWVFAIEDEYRLARLDTEHRFVTDLVGRLREPAYARAWNRHFGGKS